MLIRQRLTLHLIAMAEPIQKQEIHLTFRESAPGSGAVQVCCGAVNPLASEDG